MDLVHFNSIRRCLAAPRYVTSWSCSNSVTRARTVLSFSQICVPRYETVTSMRLGKSDFESHILQELEKNKLRSLNNKVCCAHASGVQQCVSTCTTSMHIHHTHTHTTHTHTHHTRVAYACSRSTSDTHVRCYLTPVQVVSIEGSTILTQDGYKDSASVSLLHSP